MPVESSKLNWPTLVSTVQVPAIAELGAAALVAVVAVEVVAAAALVFAVAVVAVTCSVADWRLTASGASPRRNHQIPAPAAPASTSTLTAAMSRIRRRRRPFGG